MYDANTSLLLLTMCSFSTLLFIGFLLDECASFPRSRGLSQRRFEIIDLDQLRRRRARRTVACSAADVHAPPLPQAACAADR